MKSTRFAFLSCQFLALSSSDELIYNLVFAWTGFFFFSFSLRLLAVLSFGTGPWFPSVTLAVRRGCGWAEGGDLQGWPVGSCAPRRPM